MIFPVSLVERGDEQFIRINYLAAEAIYDSILTGADSVEVFWRQARLYVCMGDVSPEGEKLELYREAEAFARRAIKADSMKSEGHTWRAAALGNIAMFEGGKTKVTLCKLIKHELECSISLNPGDDIAFSILGSFYKALAEVSWIERQIADIFLGGLPGGGYDESEIAFKKAIALAPDVIRNHSELGDLYLVQGRFDEALHEFSLVRTLPVFVASDERTKRLVENSIQHLMGK